MIYPSELERIIFEIAPFEMAEEWDNVGLLIDCGNSTDKVLFSLDASLEAISEAEELGCKIIVSHHPVIFHPLKRIISGSAVETAIRKGISVISAHTNFDSAEGGINDVLSKLLGLEEVVIVEHMPRVGYIPNGPVPLEEFAGYVKEKLSIPSVSIADAGLPVKKVMILGGAGGSYFRIAKSHGCDTLLTGEASHDEGVDAKALGVNIVVAGHYGTENPGMPAFCDLVRKKIGNKAECILSRRNCDPYYSK